VTLDPHSQIASVVCEFSLPETGVIYLVKPLQRRAAAYNIAHDLLTGRGFLCPRRNVASLLVAQGKARAAAQSVARCLSMACDIFMSAYKPASFRQH
jgi:hypothetical protein